MRTLSSLILVLSSACGALVGSGNVSSQDRLVGAFTRVSVDGALKVSISPGARSVSVRTDDNLLAAISATVHGDTLELGLVPDTAIARSTTLEATVSDDALEGLTVAGASSVTASATPSGAFWLTVSGASHAALDGIAPGSLTVDVSGASTATLKGAARSGALRLTGASAVDLRELSLETAQLDLSGGSALRARVSAEVLGTMSGASTATILGNPTVNVSQSEGARLELGPL